MPQVKQINKSLRGHILGLFFPLHLLAFALTGAYANPAVTPPNPAPNPPATSAGSKTNPTSAINKTKYARICTENERMWCLQEHMGQKASPEVKRQCPENYRAFAEANQCTPW